jgi:hypothetical protein
MGKREQQGYVSKFLRRVDAAAGLASPSTVARQGPSICKQHGVDITATVQPPSLTVAQLQVLMHASVCAAADSSLAEVFHRIEVLSAEVLGTTAVRWLHVSQWHHKLFRYAVQDSSSSKGQTETPGNSTAGNAPIFKQHFVCNVGEGIVGAVALSGQPECIADCSACSSATGFRQGSMVSAESDLKDTYA